ncbi:MAG: (2Fe-2S)-binding protein [Aquificaceae bacterium]
MDRRDFVKVCATTALACAVDPGIFSRSIAQTQGMLKTFSRAPLLGPDGKPIKESQIQPHKNYIFFYPYVSTPCFLLNLGEEIPPQEIKLKSGQSYRWLGGVGSKKSIVAYSAICAHQWSYPTKQYSFINYYPPDKPSETTKKAGIIQCCAHLALYDPKAGGSVVDGPAEAPLAAVVLEEKDGQFFATGIIGKDQFNEFFENFKQDLRQQYGSSAKAREQVDKCTVQEIAKYVQSVVNC